MHVEVDSGASDLSEAKVVHHTIFDYVQRRPRVVSVREELDIELAREEVLAGDPATVEVGAVLQMSRTIVSSERLQVERPHSPHGCQ